MPFQARPARVCCDGDTPVVAYFDDLADLFCCGGEDNEEGFLVGLSVVGRPIRAGVVLEVAFFGGDVLFAEKIDEVGPGGFKIGLAGLMVWWLGGCYGEGGIRRWGWIC